MDITNTVLIRRAARQIQHQPVAGDGPSMPRNWMYASPSTSPRRCKRHWDDRSCICLSSTDRRTPIIIRWAAWRTCSRSCHRTSTRIHRYKYDSRQSHNTIDGDEDVKGSRGCNELGSTSIYCVYRCVCKGWRPFSISLQQFRLISWLNFAPMLYSQEIATAG